MSVQAANTISMLLELRRKGWSVAVHNDYRQNGEKYTFWLFTRGDFAAKGEGKTDEEALELVIRHIARINDKWRERL